MQVANVDRVATRKVDRLVHQLGLHHLSKDVLGVLVWSSDAWSGQVGSRSTPTVRPYRLDRLTYLLVLEQVRQLSAQGGRHGDIDPGPATVAEAPMTGR